SMANPDPSTQSPATDPGPGAKEVTELLLDVLRNVNREVQTALELEGNALRAVLHCRAISLSLRTLADGNTFFNAPSGDAPRPSVRCHQRRRRKENAPCSDNSPPW